MTKEQLLSPKEQLNILERLKPNLGKFFQEMVYGEWKLQKNDVRLVDEIGFGLTGVPIYGPEISRNWPHVDIAVRRDKYMGPRSIQEHPRKIIFPMERGKQEEYLPSRIGQKYGIAVDDLLKEEDIFNLPSIEVDLAVVPVLVPEPVAHVGTFAAHTILSYSVEQAGEDKIREWFLKLKMLRDSSQALKRIDVQNAAETAITQSIERWKGQNWDWLVS